MSLLVALPREGHLDVAVHAIFHVGQRSNSRLMYDLSYQEIHHRVIKKCDWSECYRDAKEAVPTNALEPQGKEVDICMFADSDHTGDKVTCISITGFNISEHSLGAVVLKDTVYSRDISFWC